MIHPEPFASALAESRLADVADADAPDARSQLARGIVRARLGREADARADFDAAEPACGGAARVERLLMDLTDLSPAEEVEARIRDELDNASDPEVRARALHVLGIALERQRRSGDAIDALFDALRAYRSTGDRSGTSAVHDTLGNLFASLGQLEPASGYFALSIAEKMLVGDRYGAAITLGSLGRLQLQSGRFEDALDCFDLDLAIATDLEDIRGQARMANDRGRALLALDRFAEAIEALEAGLALCADQPFEELEVFIWKDLALARIEVFRDHADPAMLELAAEAIARAEALLADRPDSFAAALVQHAAGERLHASGDPTAVIVLREAVDRFARLAVPDFEIAARLSLASALRETGDPDRAERCLLKALRRAQQDGFARYLAPIRERMLELDLTGVADDESGVLELDADGAPAEGGYAQIKELGSGAFGTVYRAFDVHRNRLVAIKRLRLDSLYDPARRHALFASIQLELKAASRIRHPGIAQVLAIGMDRDGGVYVVQQLVEGRSLHARMRETAPGECGEVLWTVALIASALDALHERGVVHRDLKPSNVVLERTASRPVLIDMGVAHVPDMETALGDGAIVGTWQYMAPEQAAGDRVAGSADVYSLGVVLFEWLTGFPPRKIDTSSPKALQRSFKESPEPLSSFRDDAPEGVEALLDAMLHRSPKRRPTAREVATRLGAAAEALGLGAPE